MTNTSLRLAITSTILLTACAEDGGSGSPRQHDAEFIADAGFAEAGSTDDAETMLDATSDTATGARIFIHLRSTTAPFEHTGLSVGQTPSLHVAGIRSFQLLRTMEDPSPVTVFDYGQDDVEVDYADGADTIVGSALASDLPAGAFSVGRTVYTYVRYVVAANLHNLGYVLPGEFDNIVALSDRVTIADQVRDRGWYSFEFKTYSTTFPRVGDDFYVADETLGGGGLTVHVENGETAYYFPIDLIVDPQAPADVHAIMTFNMHESLRWIDSDDIGYVDGEWDSTPYAIEEVVQFGANSFAITFE